MMESIVQSRLCGERDGTYALLMQLVAANQTPECLHALENMVVNQIGCWRDVRGFIRYYEQYGDPSDGKTATAVIQGCVQMTAKQLSKDYAAQRESWAAKWVPREPKCRASPLLQWYYDALAVSVFPGVPDAKRRFRKMLAALSPSARTIPGLVGFVRQAERARTSEQMQTVNALWQQHLARCKPLETVVVPALSLAHSMGPGHNNCLHAGIGLALHFLHLSQCALPLLTFSSHAEWRELTAPNFVLQAQQLLCALQTPTNHLNSNVGAIMNVLPPPALPPPALPPIEFTLLIISDMEHDELMASVSTASTNAVVMTWNVSRNGRPASFHGDNPRIFASRIRHNAHQ